MNGHRVPSNNATYRNGDQRPRFMKERENDPKEYGFICPGCEIRYGLPQDKGYVDIVRCKDCYEKFTIMEDEKKERQCSRMRELYREKRRASKEQRA